MRTSNKNTSFQKYGEKPDFEMDFSAYCVAKSTLGDELRKKRRYMNSAKEFRRLNKSDIDSGFLGIENSEKRLKEVKVRVEKMMVGKRETIFDRQKEERLDSLLREEILSLKAKHGIQIMSKRSREIIENKELQDPSWRKSGLRSRMNKLSVSSSAKKPSLQRKPLKLSKSSKYSKSSKKEFPSRNSRVYTSVNQLRSSDPDKPLVEKVSDEVETLKRKHKKFLKSAKKQNRLLRRNLGWKNSFQ